MSVRFHISKDGTARQCRAQSPATCRATKSEHKEHYTTQKEAQKAYEEKNNNVSFATLEKEWKKFEEDEAIEQNKEKTQKYDKESTKEENKNLTQEKTYTPIKTTHHNKKHNVYMNRLNKEFEREYNKIPNYGYYEDYESSFINRVDDANLVLDLMENELLYLHNHVSREDAVSSRIIYNEAALRLYSKIYDYYDERLEDLEDTAVIDPSYKEPKKPFFKTKKYETEYKKYKNNMKQMEIIESNKLKAEEEINYIVDSMKENKFIHKKDIEEIFQNPDNKIHASYII